MLQIYIIDAAKIAQSTVDTQYFILSIHSFDR